MNSERLHFLRVPLHFEHESTLNANEREAANQTPKVRILTFYRAQISPTNTNQLRNVTNTDALVRPIFIFRTFARTFTDVHK